jgi:hypothetical protein
MEALLLMCDHLLAEIGRHILDKDQESFSSPAGG